MAYSRTFEPDRILPELDAIQAWIRALGLDPARVPTNARIVFHRRRITVEVYRRGPGGGIVIDRDRDEAIRDRRTVRRRRPPALASLGRPRRRPA